MNLALIPKPAPPTVSLKTAVVIDYQNVHLTAADMYRRGLPRHESLIHPLHFANKIIARRNSKIHVDMPRASLKLVDVYRGLPDAIHDSNGYAHNMAQRAEWTRADSRVDVTLRPLKYKYQYRAEGRKATDPSGNFILCGSPSEKGVDVLVALAAIRAAMDPEIDLVILASRDTDLVPVLDEIWENCPARVETTSWVSAGGREGSIKSAKRLPVWNTYLDETDFEGVLDPMRYA